MRGKLSKKDNDEYWSNIINRKEKRNYYKE